MIKANTKTYVYGKHTLKEALLHRPETIKKIFLAPNIDAPELLSLIKKSGIPTAELSKTKTSEKNLQSAVHQGVIGLIATEKLTIPYNEFINSLKINNDTSLVLLDELQDPQNIGAAIRSAAAFGVSGVLIPEHHQGQVTGAVLKVSAGMAFRIPIVSIGNVNNTLGDLKKRGFWIYGLIGESKESINNESFSSPTVIILGNESKGIREKTRELCDIQLSIPINPKCESLNAATSLAIALYAWSAKHPNALAENQRLADQSK